MVLNGKFMGEYQGIIWNISISMGYLFVDVIGWNMG
jgi:hypothetical protein